MTAFERLRQNGIEVNPQTLAVIARKYSIIEISVFGSSLGSRARNDSDVDLLVSFAPEAMISLFDLMDLENELSEAFQRPVDIVEPEALTNPIRRRNILSTKQLLYAA